MRKFLIPLVCLSLITADYAFAKPGRSSYGRSSFSRSRPSSSRPSSRRPSSTRPSTRPNYGKSTISTRPNTGSKRPTGTFDQQAGRSQKKQESQKTFVKSNPPKKTYKDASGKERKINSKSPSVKRIRSTSPEKIRTHTTRVEHHYHDTYGSRYDTWRSRPSIYVGGGYSPLFWYMMMDSWDTRRRAEWAYHNWVVLDAQRRTELMQDAEFARHYNAMSGPVNPNYVPAEFADNPDLMYSSDYVQAAYNPVYKTASPVAISVMLWTLAIVVVLAAGVFIWWLIFVKKWDNV